MFSNAFKVATRSTLRRRFASQPEISKTFLTLGKDQTFRENWLRDPAVFPLIFALGFAVAMCAGVGISCLAYNPDVRIVSDKKNSTIRDWGVRE